MNVELHSHWQGFKIGTQVEVSDLLGEWLIGKGYAKQVNTKPSIEPKKRNTRKPRKPKKVN